jgi:hypothetical protein
MSVASPRSTTARSSKLQVGDWVEVCSKDEILRTLDSKGQLDGMPFMPEMFAFCGKRFQVYKRAHKTCDTVFPVRGRRVYRAVHLDTRCDGSCHDGCQASCLLFWKDAWLKPLGKPSEDHDRTTRALVSRPHGASLPGVGCDESSVWSHTRSVSADVGESRYVCQATELPYATANLEWWDIRQYIEDYLSGNVGLWRIICGATYFLCLWLSRAGIKLGRPIQWFWNNLHPLWRGTPFPRKTGCIPDDMPTPTATLNLQPGELVRIKSHEEILKTLNTRSRNRGLYWDAEEVPYCGGTYRVLRRVNQIIDEKAGKMRHLKNPCIILDSVVCQSRYSECRLFCPRSIYSYWREIWLERVQTASKGSPLEDSQVPTFTSREA